jgi:transposase
LLSNEGYRVSEISVREDLFPDKVRKWIRRYEDQGASGLQKKPRSVGGWKVSEELKELALSPPRSLGYKFSTWTLAALCGAAVERGIVPSLTREWLGQILMRQGIKWRESGLILKSRAPQYALKKTA